MSERNLKETLQNLLKKNHLLSVVDILESLEKSGRSFNKTSVYRSLDQLVADNIVCKHHFNENQALYELREDHHTHLVCKKCGLISASECNYHHPSQIEGFAVDHHHITLVGLCKKCVG